MDITKWKKLDSSVYTNEVPVKMRGNATIYKPYSCSATQAQVEHLFEEAVVSE